MIEHHLQKHIIDRLVECEAAHYSELKPAHIDGNTFTYHLKNVIKLKLVTKNANGTYSLTNTGKLYGINNSLRASELLEQAHSVLFVCVRRGEEWLLRRRLVQPLYGKIGFIHGEPRATETIEQAGLRILNDRTGLIGSIRVRGAGFISLHDASSVVAYSSFTLLEAYEVNGDLITADPHGENAWYAAPDFASPEMIPSMKDLVDGLSTGDLFFVDKTYQVLS